MAARPVFYRSYVDKGVTGRGEANGACPSCAYVQLQLLAVSTRQAALTYPQQQEQQEQQHQQPPLAFGLRQQRDMYTYVCKHCGASINAFSTRRADHQFKANPIKEPQLV